MKRQLAVLIMLMAASIGTYAQKIVFMPHWLPQAQFIGYYIAAEKGFYEEEGLDVEIRHLKANSRKKTTAYLKSGEINATSMMLINAMTLADSGMDIVNILQISQSTGLCCVTREPVSSFRDIDGYKVGRWTTGYSEYAIMGVESNNLSVEWVPLLNSINAFIAGAVDATLCYSFNESIQLYLATGKDWSANTIKMADIGYDYPDDGLYVTAEFYDNNREAAEKFAAASKRGWEWAVLHPDEALDICINVMTKENVSPNRIHQKMMLDEMLRLLKEPKSGIATFSKVNQEVFDEISEKAINAGLLIGKPDYNKMFRP